MNCADCKQKPVNRCQAEGFDCTGGKIGLPEYNEDENRDLQNLSDLLRQIHGDALSRLEEVMEFCRQAGYGKLGIAFCVSLKEEAKMVQKVLRKYFDVVSVICKVGGLDKEEHGMTKIGQDGFEVACNPVGQAKVLNRAGTDLNIQLGLCIGHDILFNKYSDAPVTVLAVKDRVLANNPLGVVYGSFWRKRLESKVQAC